jgi:hypothetical protein
MFVTHHCRGSATSLGRGPRCVILVLGFFAWSLWFVCVQPPTTMYRFVSARPAIGRAGRLMVLFLLLFSTSIAFAQSLPPVISITPAVPTQSDLLHIRIDTNNICYPPPGDGIVAKVSGATIQIEATLTCTALTTPPPPFTFGLDVGPLSAGLYQVQYLAGFNGGVPTVLATAPVQVRSSVTPNPSYAGEKLRFSKVLPGGLCYDQIQIQNISTSGNEVTVAYTITAIPPAVSPIEAGTLLSPPHSDSTRTKSTAGQSEVSPGWASVAAL